MQDVHYPNNDMLYHLIHIHHFYLSKRNQCNYLRLIRLIRKLVQALRYDKTKI